MADHPHEITEFFINLPWLGYRLGDLVAQNFAAPPPQPVRDDLNVANREAKTGRKCSIWYRVRIAPKVRLELLKKAATT